MTLVTGMTERRWESTRDSYDRVADAYAARLFDELRHKPLDRQLLDRFGSDVAGRGDVCDMGCGPGQVARYLRDAGAAVFGLDLFPRMIAEARRLNPDIPFREGNMMALDLPDGALAGIAAFYAIVNLAPTSLRTAFGEMARVLRPAGLLLLAFHAGCETLRERELWGRPIDLEFFFFEPDAICGELAGAGLAVEDVVERGPYAPGVEYQSRRAYVFARKPAPSGP